MAFAILETKGAIAVLTVNNPKALNALSPAVLQDIDAAIDGHRPLPHHHRRW